MADINEMDLDAIRGELAELHEKLAALPADDFDNRQRLRERQAALRGRSQEIADELDVVPTETLKAAFQRLSASRDRLVDRKLSPAGSSVGDSGVADSFRRQINSAMDEGLGIDDIEKELKEVLTELKERE